jgi:hypothetical protein
MAVVASTQTYNFFFNGGANTAYLNLDFTLQGDVILGGNIYDPACGGLPGCPPEVDLVGGTLVATPLPSALSLFATGLGATKEIINANYISTHRDETST